jgi:hypothetical protein
MGEPDMDWVREPVRFETTLAVVSKVNVPVKIESLGAVIGSWNVWTTE